MLFLSNLKKRKRAWTASVKTFQKSI